jgi:adenylate cyclase
MAVSQKHCRIQAENGSFLLRDLKSTTGTFVNGLRIAEHALEDGNLISVGETTLLFRTG